jgi:uncharacterized protein
MSGLQIERRMTAGEVRVGGVGGDEGRGRLIFGYAARFNSWSEDLGGFIERIAPNAFAGVVEDDVRALFNHDPNLVLGRVRAGTLRVWQDEVGLAYEIDAPDTQVGRDLLVSMARGDVNQSSFAFYVAEDEWGELADGMLTRTIKRVGRLYDVSPVTYPAYSATVSGVRDLSEIRTRLAQGRTAVVEATTAEVCGDVWRKRRQLDLLTISH